MSDDAQGGYYSVLFRNDKDEWQTRIYQFHGNSWTRAKDWAFKLVAKLEAEGRSVTVDFTKTTQIYKTEGK